MTVNKLIAELQVLVAQGHGELDVAYEGEKPFTYLSKYNRLIGNEIKLISISFSTKPLPRSFE